MIKPPVLDSPQRMPEPLMQDRGDDKVVCGNQLNVDLPDEPMKELHFVLVEPHNCPS